MGSGEGEGKGEGGEVFRVRVSLERYYSDERAWCYMCVRGARPVRSLARRLRRAFRLPRPFALLADGHLLPPDEPLALLRPDDAVHAVPTGWAEDDAAVSDGAACSPAPGAHERDAAPLSPPPPPPPPAADLEESKRRALRLLEQFETAPPRLRRRRRVRRRRDPAPAPEPVEPDSVTEGAVVRNGDRGARAPRLVHPLPATGDGP